MGTAARAILATSIFALFHSLLASRQAKDLAARIFGAPTRDAGYRLFYNVQALATLPMLVAYISSLPERTLYTVHGRAAGLMRGIQGAGLLLALLSAREVGILRLAGVSNLLAALGRRPIPPGPAAQGPEQLETGELSAGGPFQWTRHPLNLSPIPVFWCTPHMTSRRLAFNIAGTIYLVVGSAHEEHRLKALYGEEYEAYRYSGVPFFLPRRTPRDKRSLRPTCEAQIAPRPA